MSNNLTLENFSVSNRPRKAEVECWIAEEINREIQVNKKYKKKNKNGIDILSLTGPNLKKHVEIYFPLCKKDGHLYSAEIEKSVFKLQLAAKMLLNMRDRIHLANTDFFEVGKYIARNTMNSTIFLDFDGCITFKPEILDQFVELFSYFTNRHIFLSMTFSQRRQKERDFMLNALTRKFPEVLGQERYCSRCSIIPYADDCPMLTSLYSFPLYF